MHSYIGHTLKSNGSLMLEVVIILKNYNVLNVEGPNKSKKKITKSIVLQALLMWAKSIFKESIDGVTIVALFKCVYSWEMHSCMLEAISSCMIALLYQAYSYIKHSQLEWLLCLVRAQLV